MKIKKIEAYNFRKQELQKLNFNEKTMALTGANGAGKSSTVDLIKFAITGDATKEDINKKFDYTLAEVELESGTSFSRFLSATKPSKVTLNGKTVTGKALGLQLRDETGVTTDEMKIVTSSEVIEGLKPEQFGDFILGYIPEELDVDILVEFANKGAGVTPMDADTENYLRGYFPEMPNKFGMDAIKGTFKEVSDSKRVTKRTLDEKKASAKRFEGNPPTKNMEDIDKLLDEIAKKEAVELTKKKALETYNNAKKVRQNQEDRIVNLQKQIDAISATRPNEKEIEDLKNKLEISRKESNEAVFVANQLKNSIKIYKQQLKNLEGAQCPLVEGLTCTMDREIIKEEIRENIVSTEEGIEIQEKICVKKANETKELSKKLDEMQKSASEYTRKVLLMNNLDELKKTLITIPEKPEEEVFDYSEEKASLKKERERIFEYEQHLKILKEIEYYEKAHNIYADLAGRLSPKGCIVNEVTQYYLGTVEDEINKRAEELKKDFKVRLIAEDGVKLFVEKNKVKLPYNSLSSGEKAYVLFLIMDMFNSLSGLNILLMDDLEKLDKEAFNSLIDLIMTKEIQDQYDHIIISMVNHKELVDKIKSFKNIQLEILS